MKNTKSNILNAALSLFNAKGFVNVRLQHIADEANVSVGNLAYHYESKQAILLTLYQEIAEYQTHLLRELNVVPLFEHIDWHWDNLFRIQQEYRFFFIDALEVHRSNPTIATKHQTHIQWEIAQLNQMINFNISRGAFEGTDETISKKLAELLWTYQNTWQQEALIRGEKELAIKAVKEKLWLLLKTYFTEIGHLEYNQLLNIHLQDAKDDQYSNLHRPNLLRPSDGTKS